MNNSIQVRELKSLQDQDSGRKIFDLTWAMDAGTEITPNLLQAMVHSGAYLSGAFIENKIVGAAFAFPATNNGLHLHSHMTAVLDEYRDKGVGYALKVDQWNWAKKQKYGAMPDALNAGDESDRLMVSWSTDIDELKARELITHPKPDDILIEIPEDIVVIRSKNQRESMKWRRQVRDQFLAAFEKNGKVVGFSVNNEYVVRI